MSQKRRAALWMCAAGIVVLCAAVALRLKPVPPSLILEPVWTDVVKKGSMQLEVLGRGTLVRDRRFRDLVVRMVFPEKDAQGVRSGRHADIYIANTITARCVRHRYNDAANRSSSFDIVLKGHLPSGARVGDKADAKIHLGEIRDVYYVGRAAHVDANTTMSIFKVIDSGERAQRIVVRFGRASVNTIEVLDGLKEGDRILLADMSAWDHLDQISLR